MVSQASPAQYSSPCLHNTLSRRKPMCVINVRWLLELDKRQLVLAHVCNGHKPSCSHFFSTALQQSYRECVGHIRDVVLFIRDVGLSLVVPNEHARLVFQQATRFHNVLDTSQPTLDWPVILRIASMARPAFTRSRASKGLPTYKCSRK